MDPDMNLRNLYSHRNNHNQDDPYEDNPYPDNSYQDNPHHAADPEEDCLQLATGRCEPPHLSAADTHS